MTAQTATQALLVAGFGHRRGPNQNGCHEIYRLSDGEVVVDQMLASEVWGWIRSGCRPDRQEGKTNG